MSPYEIWMLIASIKKNALFQFILCTNFVISFHFVSYIFEQILFGNFSYKQCSDILNDLMKKNSSWNDISENISLWTLNISLLTYRMEEDVSKLTLPTFFLGFFYSGINITDLKLCKTTTLGVSINMRVKSSDQQLYA